MKLSTKTRYGTRLMLDLAKHYRKGFVQLGDIAKKQGISMKYLEQIIIPLRKSRYVEGIRGAKGGYRLARAPEEITVGEIVATLEKGMNFTECVERPGVCIRSDACLTRDLWKETAEVMYHHLSSITLTDLLEREKTKAESRSPSGRRPSRKGDVIPREP